MSAKELRAALAAGRIGPLYLLEGPDDQLKSELANLFSDTIEAELRAFNVERLYASDSGVEPSAVVDIARTLPMMASRRVVVVFQAERILNPKREGESVDEWLAPLTAYIEQPLETTTAVFVVQERLDGNRRLTKLLRKHAVVVECGGLAPRAELAVQIDTQAREVGVTVDRAAIARLIALSGDDPAKLRADTERVLVFVGRGVVTAAHVDQVAEAVEKPADDWELVRAIERGDARSALRELRLRLDEGDNVFRMLGQIASAIRSPKGRMPDHRLRSAVEALLRTDTALKSSGGNPRMLLERLIVELCG